MSFARAEYTARANERRLAQLSGETATPTGHTALRLGAPSGGRVSLQASYAAQHREYVELWRQAWRREHKRWAHCDGDGDNDSDESDDGKDRSGPNNHAARDSSNSRDGRSHGGNARRVGPRRELAKGCSSRAASNATDTYIASDGDCSRDPCTIREDLAEGLRVLRAWRAVQSARDARGMPRRQGTGGGGGGIHSSGGNGGTARLADSARELVARRDLAALRALHAEVGGRGMPQRIAPSVFAALMQTPSRTAMAAPAPRHTPPPPWSLSPTSQRGLQGALGSDSSTTAVKDAAGFSPTAIAVAERAGFGAVPAGVTSTATAASVVPPVGPPAPGTAGGTGGYHLCAVCLRHAPYRCVRCKTALVCSINCHVVHDATRCLKFIV